MPSKAVIMWRLCDWYLKANVSMPQDKLIEIYRAITKPAKIPYLDWSGQPHSWGGKPDVNKETVIQWQKIAVMFRYMYGTLLKKIPDGWEIRWVWQGHRHEFPHLFKEDEVKEDLKNAKKAMAKEIQHDESQPG